MNMEQMQDLKRMKADIEALKQRVKEIENRPKPGRKPQRSENAIRQSNS
jgi:hypothetical protein